LPDQLNSDFLFVIFMDFVFLFFIFIF